MPDQSSISPERQKFIDDLNEALPGGPILRYDANEASIAQAQERAFEARVDRLAYEIASDGEDHVPTEAQWKAKRPIARLRLQGIEKRGVFGKLLAGLRSRQESIEEQRVRLEAEEQRILEVTSQYESLLERRGELAKKITLAGTRYDDLKRRSAEIEFGISDLVLNGAEAISPGNPLAPIWEAYQSWQSAVFALTDRDRVMKNLNQRLEGLDAEIAVGGHPKPATRGRG